LCRSFGNTLRRKRGRFFRAPELQLAGTCPRNSIAHKIGYCNNGIVERCLNVQVPFIYGFFLFSLFSSSSHYFLRLLFLTGDGLFLALSGTGIGSGSLAAEGQALPVPESPVTSYIHKAFYVQGNFCAEPAFNLIIRLQNVPERIELFLGKIVDHSFGVYPGFDTNFIGAGSADAENIGQSDINVFIREVNSHKPRHTLLLALLLFMLGILANDANNPVPLDYFAFIANWFNTCPDFHPFLPQNN
jgi:hypothetical protein